MNKLMGKTTNLKKYSIKKIKLVETDEKPSISFF